MISCTHHWIHVYLAFPHDHKSATKNIFVVTSEWDTQIAKQLRIMDALDDTRDDHIFNSRVFSTEVGIRPAEPCSLTVAATHQLLTNLFEYIAVVILSDRRFRRVTGSVISERDLQVLEKCNKLNVDALTEIVGANRFGGILEKEHGTESELRAAGNVWADHILENVAANKIRNNHNTYSATGMWLFCRRACLPRDTSTASSCV